MAKLLSGAKDADSFLLILQKSLVISILLLGGWWTTHAQDLPFNKFISASYTNKTIREIIDDLHQQTGIRFSYSPDKIPETTKVTVHLQQVSIGEALTAIFRGLPVTFEFIDNYIILKKSKEVKPELVITDPEQEKPVTFNGYIRDENSGEFLIGATLYFKELGKGAVTNNYGYFSLTVPPGIYQTEISYLGYEKKIESLNLRNNIKLDFRMIARPSTLEEVVITSFQAEDQVFKMMGAQSKMTSTFVKRKPALMGESDVIKALEFQPGISFYGDGSSYFHVRGGNLDQNLILLDEATIFNPSHMLGIFSPIIPDAVSNVDIYKADFPVNFGGRLSSVIDIHTRDGNRNNFSGTLNLGFLATRGTIEGPIKKDASSYFLSFRKSYFDSYLKAANPNLKNLYFSDFNLKTNLKLGAKDRLFLTIFAGEDFLRIKKDNDQVGLNWGNKTLTLRWNHVFRSTMFLNSTLSGSQYEYFLYGSVNNGEYWKSGIANQSLKEELTWYINPQTTWKIGVKLSTYQFNPGNYFKNSTISEYQVSPVNSVETSVYAGVEKEFTQRLKLNYGLRLIGWADFGSAFVIKFNSAHEIQEKKTYAEGEQFYNFSKLEPRLSAVYRIGKQSSVNAGYTKVYQNLNLITNSISPFNSFEVWLPSGPNIKPQSADIYNLGFVSMIFGKSINFQLNTFYKTLNNQIGYSYHANMLLNPAVEGELRQGKGWSYGIEFSLRKEIGKLSGQLAYTWSRSFLKIPGLNNDNTYPATWDKPHNFTISLAWQPKTRWTYSLDYCLSSGSRVTTPTSFYYYQGYQVPVYASMNNDQFPLYSRTDFSIAHRLNKKEQRFSHFINFAIMNVLGKQNPIFLYFNKTETTDGKLIIPADQLKTNILTPSVRYTFWIIPSINYQLKF